jgi:hypothetical protein
MKEGIIFVGTEPVNITQAEVAVKSIRKHCRDLHITMFTNIPESVPDDLFDSVITIEKKGGMNPLKTYDKVLQLINTPYERTLFMDTDIYVMDDLKEMFRLLDRFDMAFAHAHYRNRTNNFYHEQGVLDKDYTPYAFTTIQTGVLLYKKNEAVWNALKEFQNTYEQKQYFYDQASFKETIWNSDLRIWVLPEEYNFNSIELLRQWKEENFKTALPKIFHYTLNKEDDIEKLITGILESKSPAEPKKENILDLSKKVIKKIIR